MKVRSSVIRESLQAFADAEIRSPDDHREIVFPSGVPVNLIESKSSSVPDARTLPLQNPKNVDRVTTGGEGNVKSDASIIQEQALMVRDPEEADEKLLNDKPNVEANKDRSELMSLAK